MHLHILVLDLGRTFHHYTKLRLEPENAPNSLISGSRDGTPATNLPPRFDLRRPKTRAAVEVVDGAAVVVADDLNHHKVDRV